MTLRTILGIFVALALAAAVAIAVGSRLGHAPVPASTATPVTPAPPPGVHSDRWIPLGPTSGIALGPTPEIEAPGVIHTGELWVRAHGQWRIVRLPDAPHDGPATVPAAF